MQYAKIRPPLDRMHRKRHIVAMLHQPTCCCVRFRFSSCLMLFCFNWTLWLSWITDRFFCRPSFSAVSASKLNWKVQRKCRFSIDWTFMKPEWNMVKKILTVYSSICFWDSCSWQVNRFWLISNAFSDFFASHSSCLCCVSRCKLLSCSEFNWKLTNINQYMWSEYKGRN